MLKKKKNLAFPSLLDLDYWTSPVLDKHAHPKKGDQVIIM